jgi:hypothetical protein
MMAICPRYLALPCVLSMGISCGHGPPERTVSIGDYDTPNGAELTIALRDFNVFRPARGLSAIPSGGFPITLDRGVELNVCRKLDGSFRQVAVVHEPPESTTSFSTPTITAWLDTAVRISGTTGRQMVVRLPSDVHVGTSPKQRFERRALPECAKALDELRRSNRMPDGTLATPP